MIRAALAASVDPLTPEEEKRLFLRWRDHGDTRALDTICRALQRYIAKIAQAHARRSTLGVEELFLLANEGLMRALHRFDPERGLRITTFANHWMHRFMLDGIADEGAPFGSRSNHGTKLAHTLRAVAVEIFESADQPGAIAALRRTHKAAASLKPATLLHVLTLAYRGKPLSLDAPTGEDNCDWYDSIPGQSTRSDDALEREQRTAGLHERVEQAMALLTPREQLVIRATVLCHERTTCADVGRQLGVSRERARQLQARALQKLRAAFLTDGGIVPTAADF